MPAGRGYSGKQGESGNTPEAVGSDSGAYAYSARKMEAPMSPNIQGWNANGGGPKRDAQISPPKSMNKGGSGGDY